MPKRSNLRISRRTVEALRVEGRDAVFWDRDLPGFGVRVHRTERKTYVVQTRGPAGLKRVTIGQHGEVTPEQARKDASEVIDRIKRGMDPMPEPPAPEVTIADLAERCVSAHVAVNCGPNTMKNYRNAIDAYIVPELGVLSLGAVDGPNSATAILREIIYVGAWIRLVVELAPSVTLAVENASDNMLFDYRKLRPGSKLSVQIPPDALIVLRD